MQDDIVLATPEQIEAIRKDGDLAPGSIVLAMGNDLAVIRTVTEVDPVFFADSSRTNRRALFIWGIQNQLRFAGVPAYYFNVSVDDTDWQRIVEHAGAERTSPTPEYRYVKRL